MKYLPFAGLIFYGTALSCFGIITIYYQDFPYMLIPPKHSGIPGLHMFVDIIGLMFFLTGLSIVINKMAMQFSIATAFFLLLIFCFYFIPYQFIESPNYMQFGDWENAAKELALASGALVVANYLKEKNHTFINKFFGKLISSGNILFAIAIISFGIDHFIYGAEAADYVPSWIPWRVFWIYFTGTALLGSGIAIAFNIRRFLAAKLLGLMIFTWFIILHIPRIAVSPADERSGEMASALLALAYSGTAFIISSHINKRDAVIS